VEVNPLAPVDPCSIDIPASSDLMPSYMQIFGPAQGSLLFFSAHNYIPGVFWQVRYKVV